MWLTISHTEVTSSLKLYHQKYYNENSPVLEMPSSDSGLWFKTFKYLQLTLKSVVFLNVHCLHTHSLQSGTLHSQNQNQAVA
jgi:hypothetical protein